MTTVFLLWHHYPSDPDDDDAKLLGVYSSRAAAERRVEEVYKKLPGFNRGDGTYTIDRHIVDEDKWTEGFFRAGEADGTR